MKDLLIRDNPRLTTIIIDIEDPELTMIERSKKHMEVITLYDTMLENRSYQTIMDVILHA